MIAKVILMNGLLEQALLYDFYGELLTNHQKEIYEQFVLEDLSLSEIAEAAGISRQGVHDLVKRCNKILEGYEAKLHLVEKFLSVKEKQSHRHPPLLIEPGYRLKQTAQNTSLQATILIVSWLLCRYCRTLIKQSFMSAGKILLKEPLLM